MLDAMEGAGITGGWVLDAMRLYYVDALTWPEVGEVVRYSQQHVRRNVAAVLDAAGEHDAAAHHADERGHH